ncbi:ribulose-1,5-bisphosphate carboxylase small subunit [Vibrio vulnificus]|nr:ribulose-1,5-bisphosphate carboxylase small subunit [Vibrio vulnificus]
MLTTTAVASVARPAQASMVAPFTGLKSASAFPITRKNDDITTLASNGGRVQCMKVWPPLGLKKFETLSYLPPLTEAQLAKEIDYLLRSGWVACIEFSMEGGFVHREFHASPGYYDGRYWTMWKLPMFGCTDSSQVIKEIRECEKEYPEAFIRIIGFDSRRQVQCISFIVHKPARY